MSNLYEISIELTNECTFSCLHCSSGSTPRPLPHELGYQEHLAIIRDARELGAQVLSLSGGNPLLYKNLLVVVTEAMQLGYQRLLIYTTGHNRTGRRIYDNSILNYLNIPGVTFIFSLHSPVPEVNDFIMNTKGAYNDITESISYLKAMNVDVEIHMVPMKPNFKHIRDMRELCKQLGVKKMSLLRFVPQTRGAANIDKLGMDVNDFAAMQFEINTMLQDSVHPVQVRAGCPIDFRHSVGLLANKAKPCHAGDDLMLVRPDGSVHPCAAWKSLEVDCNVRDHSLSYIWENSEVFKAIRQFKMGGYIGLEGPCEKCSMLDSCKGGCPAQRLHAHGKTLEALYAPYCDPLCPTGNTGV